ncbi:mechanosensitive ion channel domain-containing protein [Salinirussus salinus]|jgi:small-conductance mechanosensitive channel|uniref:mechanosensitive ion channel domain-containing protein n=1 Tax=Salinirussus salinus TaxID=1198300 RepID=UPI001358AF3E|nr:mechanosensitive ion channel domain-containing protein [Salinirussus salinus]
MAADGASLIRETGTEFVDGVVDALPEVLSGLIFLVLAYVVVRVVQRLVRAALERAYPGDQQLIADFGVLVVGLFMWFGAALTLLDIVGLGDIAASLGTAAGFIALGVSYALSNMIADTVAGIYLLRDPDFNPGDTVTAGSVTGTVTSIGLRKSRFEVEGDTVVVANRDVESKWTLRTGSGE